MATCRTVKHARSVNPTELADKWFAEAERLQSKAKLLRVEGAPANAERVAAMAEVFAQCATELRGAVKVEVSDAK